MNLKPITDSPDINKGEIDDISLPNIYETLNYPINVGDKVIATQEGLDENKELITDLPYEVDRIYLSNLIDMQVWVIYIKGNGVRNPYYANHFKPLNNES